MGFPEAIRTGFSRYAQFSGRARRPEYWYFFLFVVLGTLVFGLIDSAVFGPEPPHGPGPGPGDGTTRVFAPVFQLVTFLPLLAAGWRRMHDTGRSGLYLLLPVVVSLVFYLGTLFGVLGFSAMRIGAMGPENLTTGDLTGAAMGVGVMATAVGGLLQFVIMLLLLWWLTRPTQQGSNDYGPEPPAA